MPGSIFDQRPISFPSPPHADDVSRPSVSEDHAPMMAFLLISHHYHASPYYFDIRFRDVVELPTRVPIEHFALSVHDYITLFAFSLDGSLHSNMHFTPHFIIFSDAFYTHRITSIIIVRSQLMPCRRLLYGLSLVIIRPK